MSLRSSIVASMLAGAFLTLTPAEAHAQTVVGQFRAVYTWSLPYPDPALPIQAGPYRVRFTLYDDGTFVNDDGNGGEYELDGGSGDVTLWFFSQAEATAAYPPFGAATWEGTVRGGSVCNGTARSPGLDPATGYPITVIGSWNTRGCP